MPFAHALKLPTDIWATICCCPRKHGRAVQLGLLSGRCLQDSPWAPLQPLVPAGPKGLQRRCESGPTNGQRRGGGLQPTAEDSPASSASSSQQLPSLDSLLLPPEVDEPGLCPPLTCHVKICYYQKLLRMPQFALRYRVVAMLDAVQIIIFELAHRQQSL